MVNGYTFNRILACELWCNKCDLTPNGGSRWWKLQRSMRLLYVKLVKAGIGVRWMKCQGCRFVSATFSEAKPPKPIKNYWILCVWPSSLWLDSRMNSFNNPKYPHCFFLSFRHANSPDVQPSCLFFFCFLPSCCLESSFDFPREQTQPATRTKTTCWPLGSKRLQIQLLGWWFQFFCFFLSRKLGEMIQFD